MQDVISTVFISFILTISDRVNGEKTQNNQNKPQTTPYTPSPPTPLSLSHAICTHHSATLRQAARGNDSDLGALGGGGGVGGGGKG